MNTHFGITKPILLIGALTACLFGSALATEPGVQSSWREEGFICSNATLHGRYGFSITGIRPTGPGAPQVAVVGTALTTFHGDGTFEQFDNINVNSPNVPYQADRPGSGTYDLNPDCSGTMSITAGGMTLHLSIVVVNHGQELRTAVVTPNVIVSSDGRKI